MPPDIAGTPRAAPGPLRAVTEALSAVLARLDAIDARLLELLQPQAEIALLREIARSAGETAFTVSELLRHAALDPGLRAAVNAVSGDRDPARVIGGVLKRCAGRVVGGVLTARIGSDGAAAIWRTSVRPIKPALPVAADASITDDAADIREST